MDLDPYTTLGVARDASDEEVRAAAKSHACRSHPDKGGTSDAFHAGRRALVVLSDHAKRAKYDRTGRMDDDEPDNTLSEARGLVDRCVGEAVSAYLSSGNPQLDPRNIDLIDVMKTVIRAQIVHSEDEIAKLDGQAVFFRDFTRRFTLKNKKKTDFDFLKRRFDDEFRKAAASREDLKQGIRVRKLAIKIIDGYEFSFDRPPWGGGIRGTS